MTGIEIVVLASFPQLNCTARMRGAKGTSWAPPRAGFALWAACGGQTRCWLFGVTAPTSFLAPCVAFSRLGWKGKGTWSKTCPVGTAGIDCLAEVELN